MGTPEELEAFANYVNEHLISAEFGYEWAWNAFTYRAIDSAVYVRISIKDFGEIRDGIMYITSALGMWLILTTPKIEHFDARVTNDSLAVHFG